MGCYERILNYLGGNDMLKEKWENTKTFVKEHKTEILAGAWFAGCFVAGYVIGKKVIVPKLEGKIAEQNYVNAYNKAAKIAEETLIPEINKKYEQYDFSNIVDDPLMAKIYDQYIEEYQDKFNELVESLL